MAKINFAPDIASISGKLCSQSGVVYMVNKRTGETYRSDRHGYNDPKTEPQMEVRNTFKARSTFTSSWWKTNKPSASNAAGTANYQLVMKAYKSQRKIGNPYAYLRSLVTADLKVMLGDLDITGEITNGSGGTTTPTKPGGDGNLDA